jgi:hypothetical protein
MAESEYPEHETLSEFKEQSQAIGGFLDWLTDHKKVQRMVWFDGEVSEPCPFQGSHDSAAWRDGKYVTISGRVTSRDCDTCAGTGTYKHRVREWRHLHQSVESLLAEYFGIDLAKLEAEKRAMLAEIRKPHSTDRYLPHPQSLVGA